MKLIRSKNKNNVPDDIKKEVKKEHGSPNLEDSKRHFQPAADLYSNHWKVLLVDDESDVHEITRIALKKFIYDGKSLELISAYSGEQAREILQKDQDFALAIIDVVMETEESGLDLVRFIREELELLHIRLIIRTGQPGKAPEHFVIQTFDIDDYKEKTDLSNLKMYTMLRSSIKSYRDILTIERSRVELEEKVNERTQELNKTNRKLEALVVELKTALGEIKQLSGLLPICSYCKKIRDDQGYWNQLEEYIRQHSEVEFSHGICQECAEKYYSDLDLYDDSETRE